MTTTMTQGTQASAAAAATAAINNFLAVAPTKYTAILGSVAAGSTGGATANVIWQQQIPIVPAFCTAIDYEVTLPISYTATTVGGASVSPYAPYSVIANQLTLGGAPPWPLTELTPWYLDYVAKHLDYDFSYPGLGSTAGSSDTATTFLSPGAPTPYAPTSGTGVLDSGPSSQAFPTGLIPNATLTTAAVTAQTLQFKVRQQLQRKRHLLWGAVPFGDPENRPNNLTQILPFTGVNPEQTLIVLGGTTVFSVAPVLSSAATIKATYELAYIDLLPPSMTSVPNPQVGYGLQLIQFSTTGLAAGTIQPITHRTAMAYTSIHQLLINSPTSAATGGLPLRADYYGLWDDQDQQSSRWNFDAQNNTFTEYFDKFHRVYHHYPLTGQYLADFEGGLFPEIPSVTPYDAIMSPDASYAAAFGVAVTPAMTTSIRVPSGTTVFNPYVRTYAFGLVRVPY